MSSHPIDKLEQLLPALLEETLRVQEENNTLFQQVKDLQKQVEHLSRQNQKQEDQLKRMKQVEESHRQLHADNKQARKRVQNLLERLNRIPVE